MSLETTCKHPHCLEPARSCCDLCDVPFCADHGTIGGDRDSEAGPIAFPSQCWQHGGFNVDE